MPLLKRRTRGLGRTVAGEVAIIIGATLLAAALHVWAETFGGDIELSHAFASLYYLPVLYSAWVFGLRGGALAGLGVSAILLTEGAAFEGAGIRLDQMVEVAAFLAAGGLFGWVAERDAGGTAAPADAEGPEGTAYRKLEARAIEIVAVRNYVDTLVRSLSSCVLTVGPDGSVATANPAAERMLGMPESEMVPRPVANLVEDDDGLGKDLLKVLDGRLPRLMREAEMRTLDGRSIHVRASASRMIDDGGRILGAVVAMEDATELHALTQRLIRADRLAALGQLTAGVAHEIRNPLTAIRASVQLLEDPRCSTERRAEAGDVIKEEVDRVDRVIDTLLRFGRPPEPEVVPLDIRDVLRDVAMFTRRFADRAGVEVVEEYPDGAVPALGDPDQLKQVFVNLVSNAVQAMEGGGTVRLAAAVREGYVRVSVSDDGPGIPAEEIGRVFDPFFTRREDGTGLGLSIVHRIIEEHQGHIEVSSRPGEGTAFTVVLPVGSEGTVTGEGS